MLLQSARRAAPIHWPFLRVPALDKAVQPAKQKNGGEARIVDLPSPKIVARLEKLRQMIHQDVVEKPFPRWRRITVEKNIV